MATLTSLAHTTRGTQIENRFAGWLILSNAQGQLQYASPGSDELVTFFRSSAKPFQALPLLHALEKQGVSLPEEALAIACASHGGQQNHLQWVQYLLKQGHLTHNHLGCGPHPPIDTEAAAELVASGITPTALHNNCSGKHAGMLYACCLNHWPTEDYLSLQHPLQQAILKELHTYAGHEIEDTAIDGCGAPVFYLPLKSMALLYAKLATEEGLSRIKHAMSRHPELIGDPHRIDTTLMQVTQGRLIAKVGADGVICIANTETHSGLALKIESGLNPIRDQYIPFALHQLGWLTTEESKHSLLEPFQPAPITNTLNQVVGQTVCQLPLSVHV